jgi:hypothetical protein
MSDPEGHGKFVKGNNGFEGIQRKIGSSDNR